METNRIESKWEPLAADVIAEDAQRKQNSTSDKREDGYENEDAYDIEDIDYEEINDDSQ